MTEAINDLSQLEHAISQKLLDAGKVKRYINRSVCHAGSFTVPSANHKNCLGRMTHAAVNAQGLRHRGRRAHQRLQLQRSDAQVLGDRAELVEKSALCGIMQT